MSNLTNSREPEPHVFGPLDPEQREKNTRSWSRLGEKSGAGAAWKEIQEPGPEKIIRLNPDRNRIRNPNSRFKIKLIKKY